MPCSARVRIIKKIEPAAPGARRLARHYGTELVCVRYRLDEEQGVRYTTVELVVDEAPIERRVRGNDEAIVGVRIRYEEIDLRAKARESGAIWDKPAGVWRMARAKAEAIGLGSRIVSD